MKNKKNILVFIDWYLPGYKAGGPIRSCANLIEHLCEEYNFWILTRDTDYCETQPYPNIEPNTWLTLSNGSKVYYLSKNNVTASNIKRIMSTQAFDVYYLNGIFSYYFSIVPLFYLRKRADKLKVVAVRGMLAQSALAIKKHKKQAFLALARAFHLFSNVIFHATNTNECEDVKRVLGDEVQIRIAPNLAEKREVPLFEEKQKPSNMPLLLVNIARIAPEKNLLYAIQQLAKVKQQIVFDVYGPVYSQSYWEQCLAAVKLLPANIQFSYKGALESEKVASTLRQYHCLFMPTNGENFGHIILQALTAACPVIISDQTPWKNLQEARLGWDIPLINTAAFVIAIEDVARMDQTEFNKMAKAAHSKAVQIINDKITIEENQKLFLS